MSTTFRCPNLRCSTYGFLGSKRKYSCSACGKDLDLEYVRTVCWEQFYTHHPRGRQVQFESCNQFRAYGIRNSY